MFQKLVVIEPLHLLPETESGFERYAHQVVRYESVPGSVQEIISRLEGADAVLINVTTSITGEVIEQCPSLRYIGMCCTLYDDESCSVDLRSARQRGILVTGVSDYGDAGVPEFVVSELISLLHGFRGPCWYSEPLELTGFPVGVVGAGVTGALVARALKFFGADVVYHSRTPKPALEAEGIHLRPLPHLLSSCAAVCTCLNKFTVLLGDEEFRLLGDHRILFNTGLSPSYQLPAVKRWLAHGDNQLFCDSDMALGDPDLLQLPGVFCPSRFAGMSRQSVIRLSQKVEANLAQAAEQLA